ncbi:MerR family transcriptional regulator [bacterium]|nr:MerR family transcriptional regulator [bacterium]
MIYKYPIKVAAARSGLTTHLIRIWERRYGAVEPSRTPSNRRMYSDDDIQRLQLLREVTATGMSIGQVADLGDEELRAILKSNRAAGGGASVSERPGPVRPRGMSASSHRENCLSAVVNFDATALEEALRSASVDLGQMALFEEVLTPFFEQIGRLWRDGELKVAHEHMASSAVRSFLGAMLARGRMSDTAPGIVVTTPSGHSHEAGALMAAITAVSQGWRVVYLGPDTPTEDVAGAVARSGASAVAMSLVYPPDDPHVAGELSRLREMIGLDTALIVGGRSFPHYMEALRESGAVAIGSLREFADYLDTLRPSGAQA